jgi:hypothetical protein
VNGSDYLVDSTESSMDRAWPEPTAFLFNTLE